MKTLTFAIIAILFGISTVHAIPALQLYIDGAEYDWGSETWIITDSTEFSLYVIGEPRDDDDLSACDDRELEDVHLIVSTDSDTEPGDRIRIGDADYPSDNWIYGSPLSEPQFPSHGIFPAWHFMIDIGEFNEIGGIDDAVPDSEGNYFDPSLGYDSLCNHIGEIKLFEVAIPAGITNVHFDAISLDDDDMNVFAPFSHDAGYYDSDGYPPTGVDESGKSIPDKMTLSEPYPNPFNARTVISFSLPQASDFSLDLYDIQGRHVMTLAKGWSEAGVRSVVWNGVNDAGMPVATGIYLVRLQAMNSLEIKHVLLLK